MIPTHRADGFDLERGQTGLPLNRANVSRKWCFVPVVQAEFNLVEAFDATERGGRLRSFWPVSTDFAHPHNVYSTAASAEFAVIA
ncbi:hypothetical protein KCP77_02450 [Salmonella enterica subsp. enterica]|nr:hypothetical protein KCP77_02450 [Salmonella enterica subsp. enterica]